MSEPFSSIQNRHVMMKGFLTKSPPNQDSESHSGHFLRDLTCLGVTPAFLKKKWRERYCVLYKVRKQNKTEVYFEYYKDAACSKLKGRVDLSHCKDISENLKIERWSNVFSVQTQHKGQLRTYYFSAPTQEVMSKWVDSLCDVTRRRNDPPVVSPFVRRPPGVSHLSSLHSPTGTVNSTWLSDVRGQALESQLEYDPMHGEDGYNDLWTSGVYYFPTEPDDYHPLPGRNHSYVNLANLSGLEDDVTGKNTSSKRISCPNLASDAPALPSRAAVNAKTKTLATAMVTVDPVPPRPARERVTAQTKSTDSRNETPGSGKSTAFGDRRNSSNSVYLNMWEAGDGDEYVLDAPPVGPKPTSQAPVSRTQAAASGARTCRRSQLVGPELVPQPGTPAALLVPKVPTSPNTVTQEVPNVPSKPLPPPRALSTVISSLPVFPPSRNAVARVPSVEACNDLELPTRAPGLRDITDSSMESNSDSSLSVVSGDTNGMTDPLSTLKAPNRPKVHPGSDDSPPCVLKLPAEIGAKAEAHPTADEQTRDTRKSSQQQLKQQQQLNYIEPCNLELGMSITNNTNSRPLSNRCLSTAIPSTHGNLSSALDNGALTTCAGSVGLPRLGPASSVLSPDDDRIEYKEIDPISTNALAIVTKHYLDNDASPR